MARLRTFLFLAFTLLPMAADAASNRERLEREEGELSPHAGSLLLKGGAAYFLLWLSERDPAEVRRAENTLERARNYRKAEVRIITISARTEALAQAESRLEEARRRWEGLRAEKAANAEAAAGRLLAVEAELREAQAELERVHARRYPTRLESRLVHVEDQELIERRLAELGEARREHVPGLASRGFRFLGKVAGGVLIFDAALELTYWIKGEEAYSPLLGLLRPEPPAPVAPEMLGP